MRWEVRGSDISMQCEACWTGWWNICMDFTFFVVFRNGISTDYTCAGVCCVYVCAHVCVVCVCRVRTCMHMCVGCVCEWEVGGARIKKQCRK